MNKVAIMGMFRSGTNYARTVLEWNFDVIVEYNTFGWKHGLFPILGAQCAIKTPELPLLTISKHPLAALDSLFRYYSTNGKNIRASKSFESFLRSPITIFDEGSKSSVELRFRTPVDYYNTLYWNLLSAGSVLPSHTHVKYEDALSSPSDTFASLAAKLGLSRKDSEKDGPISTPDYRTLNMGEGKNRSAPADYLGKNVFVSDHYTKEKYRSTYSASDLAWVRAQIDEELMNKLGYDMSRA